MYFEITFHNLACTFHRTASQIKTFKNQQYESKQNLPTETTQIKAVQHIKNRVSHPKSSCGGREMFRQIPIRKNTVFHSSE